MLCFVFEALYFLLMYCMFRY